MQRRTLLLASLATSGFSRGALAEPGISATDIVLGQTAILSGPLGEPVKSRTAGAQLAFDEASQQGGVYGRRVRLVSLDDQLVPATAVANYEHLLKKEQVFAFFGCGGSATTAAAAPLLKQHGAPLVGGFAVADSARDAVRGSAYFLRATGRREAEALIQHLSTIGLKRIAVVYLDNPGGTEALALVEAAMSAHGLKPQASAAIRGDGSNVTAAAKGLISIAPQAVIMYLGGALPGQLIKATVEGGGRSMFYGMSIVPGEVAAKVAGDKVNGLIIAQIVPSPWQQLDPVAKQYRALAAKAKLPVDYYGYEGYLTGLMLLEALKRTGRELTRAKLQDTMRSLKFRLAGMDIDFSGNTHTGSNFVELVQVRPDGSFVR